MGLWYIKRLMEFLLQIWEITQRSCWIADRAEMKAGREDETEKGQWSQTQEGLH